LMQELPPIRMESKPVILSVLCKMKEKEKEKELCVR
jgi:hypothetical protein